jgi:iron(III) transport system ATP-binding protein
MLADRLAVMVAGPRGGRLVQVGAPQAVYDAPAGLAVAQLTGDVWTVDGEAFGDHAETPIGRVPLVVPAFGAVQVGVRPEHSRFVADPAGPLIAARSAFLGAFTRVWTRGPAAAVVDQDRAVPPGTVGRVEVARGAAWPR